MSKKLDRTAQILVVCTGNLCRSPLGERFLTQQLNGMVYPVTVRSAGTHAVLDGKPPAEVLARSAAHSAQMDDHVPRQVTDELINNADLILTAERVHRSDVVSRVPSASAKAFTLKQFARLVDEHESFIARGELIAPNVECLGDFVAEIADFRSLASPPISATDDDIADPFLLTQKAYDLAADEIEQATKIIGSAVTLYF